MMSSYNAATDFQLFGKISYAPASLSAVTSSEVYLNEDSSTKEEPSKSRIFLSTNSC